MRLIISYYKDKNEDRQKEIDACLNNNLSCQYITEIICLLDNPNAEPPKGVRHYYIHDRPHVDCMKEYCSDNKWNIIANSDIYFNDTLKNVERYNNNTLLALARHDVLPDGSIKLLNQPDAQDAWIFFGKPKQMKLDFCLGKPGCDNAFAYRAERAGYSVINPALTVNIFHLHNSGVRSYNVHDKVEQPYKTIWPHK